jgi:glyoxylase-like metal-dependent hydrolase (beta-lactamase superfamily II)
MMDAPVFRISVPNPFFEGATNVYVLPGEPVTLIDTGVGRDEAFRIVERELQALRIPLNKIGQIVLTHHHLDHFGLARRLLDRCDAQVFVHDEDWEVVHNYESWQMPFISQTRERLQAWGTPASDIESSTMLLVLGGRLLAQATPSVRLVDGQELPAGRGKLEVVHTPGHTPGSICLRHGRCLFTGDHILPNVTPNIAGGLHSPGLLGRYLESLQRVLGLPAQGLVAYPGHGDPISDVAARVQALLDHHRQREETIVGLLRTGGPKTVYEIARALFGKLHGHHVILGTAEVFAHLEKLADEDRVVLRGDRYEAA